LFKFLPGIILIQLVTTVMVVTAFNWSQDPQFIAVVVAFSLITAVLAAFWFSAIARDRYKNELQKMRERHAQDREIILLNAEREKANITSEKSKLQEQHARERERILIDAEREKAGIALESYRNLEKGMRKAHAKANFKVGVICTLAAAAGGVMIFSQLITVGMMVLIASGSGLAGYLARARHERLSRNKRLSVDEIKLLENQSFIARQSNSGQQD
jgi:Flp pilus assembly protein TadB